MRIAFSFLSQTLVILYFSCFVLNAQDGAWISQSLHPSMEGLYLPRADGCCAAYTQGNSRYMYFFDTNCGTWTELDLGSTQVFHDMIAEGNAVMAFTDSLLIGYSGCKSKWDTVYYAGELLQADKNPPWRGYGCGESLAFFVTDSYFYIFDAVLGTWMSHSYTLPERYSGYNAIFWSHEDYAAATIPNYDGYNYICLNMAYSLHTHSFSMYEEGGSPSTGYLYPSYQNSSHGYVSGRIDDDDHLILWYTAFSNSYHPLWIYGENHVEYGSNYTTESLDSMTVSAYYYNENVSVDEEIVHMFGFDTRREIWTMEDFNFNPNVVQAGYSSVWRYGGQVAVASKRIIDRNSPDYLKKTFIIFNGQTGQFYEYEPDLDASSTYPVPGGTVIMGRDDNHLWFHSVENSQSLLQPLRWIDRVDDFYSENFIAYITSESEQDSADVYIYNGDAGTCLKKTIWKNANDIYGNSKMCVIYGGEKANTIYLYSGVLNDITEFNFPEDNPPSIWSTKRLSVIRTSSYSILYDCYNNRYFEGNYEMQPNGMGNSVAVMKKNDNTINTYSIITDQWKEFVVPEDINVGWPEDAIGLLLGPSYSVFYAYNGYNDKLIRLEPSGTHRSYKIADKTVLICRDDSIYAFNPQTVTSIKTPKNEHVATSFYLKQNYPNPFNSVTQICYSVETSEKSSAQVKLEIYNLLGEKLETLVSEEQEPGTYRVHWDASEYATGIYIYRLGMDDIFKSRKMILLK